MTAQLHHGDCRDIVAAMPSASVDAIVTDPPYELGFMGRAWDSSGVAYNVALWRECLRVLKPGGHLLSFGGTRTYHRMAAAIEDAGFEIRDSIHWIYGSGFPKSLDVSKAIDKKRYDRAQVYEVTAWIRAARDGAGVTNRQIDDAFGANGMGRHWTDVPPHGMQPSVPTLEQVPQLLAVFGMTVDDVPDDVRRLLWDLNGRKGQPGENWARREVIGTKTSGIANKDERPRHTIGASKSVVVDITAPATDAALQWEGWGTALKPAHEPIVLARKPLIGTVADNVQTHGTGALNIDATRVGYVDGADFEKLAAGVESIRKRGGTMNNSWKNSSDLSGASPASAAGRWPANVILDEDAAAGNDWARYFYCAKASKAERNAAGVANIHPTVKPLALMRYLVRLVTPPGGTVLEPFAGSGTTMAAAILEGFDVIGCEMTDDYLPIIRGRIAWAHEEREREDNEPKTLFEGDAA